MIVLLVGCMAAAGLAGCGSGGSTSSAGAGAGATTPNKASGSVHFAKTKFVLHAGLAFGAFHHFIYKPIKAGALRHPFSHKLTLIKAGLAALFVSHELKLAAADVRSSKLLSRLFSPLTTAADKLKALRGSLASGSANPSDVSGLNSQLSRIGGTAASKGQPISETVPSASQLASGG